MALIRDKHAWLGVAFLAVIALVVAGAVAIYQGTFNNVVPITVLADRAGLTLEPGADVKFHGVPIGHVTKVAPAANGARVDIVLDRDRVELIPQDATAQIVPPTAFGAKYLQLTAPTTGPTTPIASGSVISTNHVTVEVNTAFANLTGVLNAAQPKEVNGALSSLALALDQRGTELGQLITTTEHYIAALDPSVPQLTADIRNARAAIAPYTSASPNLLTTLHNSTVISGAISRDSASYISLLSQLTTFSRQTDGLVLTLTSPLLAALNVSVPATSALARYSPELPCIVNGAVYVNKLAEPAVGGTNRGISTYTQLKMPSVPYSASRNLPSVGDDPGPNCYGLPYVGSAADGQPINLYRTGVTRSDQYATSPSTALTGLFGGILNQVGP